MATNPNWPLMALNVAFNSGFSTPWPEIWTDLTSRMWSLGCGRGRQYELDENQAGTGQIVLADKDEVLNPANTGGTYYPFVLPYREIVVQAQWPPAPIGSAVNLMNGLANDVFGPYDPSFESYSLGSQPGWMNNTGGASVTIGNVNPHTGSQAATWSVVGAPYPQGFAWDETCIPGQQYTVSAWVRQTSASTMRLCVVDATKAYDYFLRTVSGGLGTATSGAVWNGNNNADYGVANGVATLTPSVFGSDRLETFNTGAAIQDLFVQVGGLTALPTTNTVRAGLTASYSDDNDNYVGYLEVSTTGAVTANIASRVGGTFTVLASVTVNGVNPLQDMVVRFMSDYPELLVWVWQAGTPMPSNPSVTVNDTSLSAGFAGLFGRIENSGGPTTITYKAFYANLGTAFASTTTTGSYVRLTATFTATNTVHNFRLSTVGTALAGTAYADDLQLEPGATAHTATTSGPVIYGVHRGFVERWPSKWNYRGMYGYAELTTVDAFAALAAREIHSAYRSAVLALSPDYYWPLGEPSGATTFAEASNTTTKPSLISTFFPTIPGDPVVAGSSIAIPGDPSGVGAGFTETAAFAASGAGTFLAAGPSMQGGFTPVAVPSASAVASGTWAVSFACWVNSTAFGSGASCVPIEALFINADGNGTIFEALIGDGSFAGNGVNVVVNPVGFNYAGLIAQSSQFNAMDGKSHLLAGVITQNPTTTTINVYWDGSLLVTKSGSTPTLGSGVGQAYLPADTVAVGLGVNGVVSHAAVWNRALAAADITALWTAGQGYVGENSGTRIERYLSEVGYTGLANEQTGLSTMGADANGEGANLLTAALAVNTTENGNFWVNQWGEVEFHSRIDRYTNTSAQWVLGELETPYLEDIAFDFDPQLVYNTVTVANAGGASPNVVDLPSQSQYGPRSLSRNVNVQSDNEATDAANWLLHTHKDPHQRVAQITLDPASNPALWPVVLQIGINDRVTLKRRTAAFTMQADYFVEQVQHSQAPDSWTVTLQMSPASLWPTPWILDSATYSVLGTSTVLGY